MYETSDLRKNLKILLDDDPYIVIESQFVKPGKGVAFTRTKLRNMLTGNVINRTFRSGEKIGRADLQEQRLQFLYADDMYHFMNTETYDQLEISEDFLDDDRLYLTETLEVDILFFNMKPIGITLPIFIEGEVTETEPGIKGDTAQGATKPAKISSGAKVMVPLFVNEGDWIKVDTRSREYIERVKR
ncbi:MAG: elongation factor P [Deltaproteobacteria bacterium]|nr:elongation factor P [Deltaproteobacteria bacterium]